MIHRFATEITNTEGPRRFTWPFHYVPHQWCRQAACQLQALIATDAALERQLAEGKMLGVLVVRDNDGELGFLAAFSGNVGGRNRHRWFVPPICDLLAPEGVYKRGEAMLDALNKRIGELERSTEREAARRRLEEERAEAVRLIDEYKQRMATAKQRRDQCRQRGDDEAALIAESQFMKAELRRLKAALGQRVAQAEEALAVHDAEINALKQRRHAMSEDLQRELFRMYRVNNGRGDESDLLDIFDREAHRLPPAGAGECCAPKLLQYAYSNGLSPLCMAEFWYGRSPDGELRRHGEFYPACRAKCLPILTFMLQGLDVESNPLASDRADWQIQVLYRDEYLIAIDKPAGMLCVPGKDPVLSLADRVAAMLPEGGSPRVVHRLDMATSGIVLFALTAEVQKAMQRAFAARRVKKTYHAVLQGRVEDDKGKVVLPLRLNPDDRPRQMVDVVNGRPALTYYEVAERDALGRTTRVVFRPVTGRTHQLRLHAASPRGLNCPIVGDALYGTPGQRLMLHASRLAFVHPVTGERVVVESPPPF